MISVTTQAELLQFLSNLRAPTQATLVSRTAVRMNKKDCATKSRPNLLPTIYKISTKTIELNSPYADKVNDARAMELKVTDFEAEGLPYGEWLSKSIIKKDDQLYLRTVWVANIAAVYEDDAGHKYQLSDFNDFVPKSAGSIRQGLDEQVIVNNYKLENVLGLRIGDKFRFSRVEA